MSGRDCMPSPLARQSPQYDVDWTVRREHCQLRPPTAHEVSEDLYMSPLGFIYSAHEINLKLSADFANFHNGNVKLEHVSFEFVYDHY